MKKFINFGKLKEYPTNSYAFLWVILCCLFATVQLTGMFLISQVGNLQASAAFGSAISVCSFSPASVDVGKPIQVWANNGNTYGKITIQGVYLTNSVTIGALPKRGSVAVVIPSVQGGLYMVRVNDRVCKTAAGGDLAIQEVKPSPIPTPSPTPKPSPTLLSSPTPPSITTACYVSPSSVDAGGSITVAGKGFGGLTYTAQLLGMTTTQFYNLGPFNGNTGTYILPPTAGPGMYTVRIFSGPFGDNGVICTPILVIN